MSWWTWFWISTGMNVIQTIIAYSRIHVLLRVVRDRDKDQAYLQVKALFGLIKFRYEIPYSLTERLGFKLQPAKLKRSSDTVVKQSERTYSPADIVRYYQRRKLLEGHTHGLSDWTKQVLAKVECTRFKWISRIGAGDAAETALLTGLAWGMKSSIVGILSNRLKLTSRPTLSVTPEYNKELFTSHFLCLVRFRVWLAFIAGLYLLFRILRGKGLSVWWNVVRRKRQPAGT